MFSLLIISGCTQEITNNSKNDNSPDNPTVEEKVADNRDADISEETIQENINEDENKAIQDAQTFVRIIKEKNAGKLLNLLNESNFYSQLQLNKEQADKIIEGFDMNFALDSLAIQIYYDGIAMNPSRGQYEFLLLDNRNDKEYKEENSLLIRYEENGAIVYHNPYIRYFPYAETMVHKYLDLISEGSVTELASFMNPDDIEVPNWVADETISNYKDNFDSMSMSLRYVNSFIFVIENEEGKKHQIEVIYGDGLMSIKDDFIPDFDY